MKPKLAFLAATAALGVAAPASAAIILTAGNHGGTGVHSDPRLNAPTVTGHVGAHDTDPLVTFTTTGDNLVTSGRGESKYEAEDGSLDDLLIQFSQNYASVTFNLNAPNREMTSMLLSVNGGAQTFAVPGSPGFTTGLGSGQNKFIVTATGADAINSLFFTFDAGVQDIRQIRVVAALPPPPAPVPEPATWAIMILGFAGAGAALRRRRGACA